MALRQDFTIEKGAKFYKEFLLRLADDTPETLVGYTVACYIKESPNTTTLLHNLTEANGGVIIISDPSADFALSINSEDTIVDVDYAWYDVVKINTEYPDEETVRILEGRITYTPGITI